MMIMPRKHARAKRHSSVTPNRTEQSSFSKRESVEPITDLSPRTRTGVSIMFSSIVDICIEKTREAEMNASFPTDRKRCAACLSRRDTQTLAAIIYGRDSGGTDLSTEGVKKLS